MNSQENGDVIKTMLVLGATSDIGRATSSKFAQNGWNLILAGRAMEKLEGIARDISVKTGKTVPFFEFIAGKTDAESFWNALPLMPDAVLCAIGLLGNQEQARHDPKLASEIITANYSGLVSILSIAANTFEKRKSGLIIGISSVAGERGRASNYVYGSAKAGFTAFLSGLRNRLAKSNVHVLTVKPGFVRTRMTERMRLPASLTAKPAEVADSIWESVQKQRNCVYCRKIWDPIMTIIRLIPESVFRKMDL